MLYSLYFYFILVFKVLANPLFLLLTFSVVTGRTAMRAFGMLVFFIIIIFLHALLVFSFLACLCPLLASRSALTRRPAPTSSPSWQLQTSYPGVAHLEFHLDIIDQAPLPCGNCDLDPESEEKMAFCCLHSWHGCCCWDLW